MIYYKPIRYLFIFLIISILSFKTAWAKQCQATTKKGTQCKRESQINSNYCFQHKSESNKITSKKTIPIQLESTSLSQKEKSHKTKMDNSSSKQCQTTTKKGKRCSRSAKSGSNYCWQHSK